MYKLIFGLFGLVFLLASCGPTVRTVKPGDQDLSKYRSFAYLPNSNMTMPGDQRKSDEVNGLIVSKVNEQMKQQGYKLDRTNPDLLVLLSVKTTEKTETTRDPVYASYPYRTRTATVDPYYNDYYYTGFADYDRVVGYDVDTYNYTDGTLVVNLVDAKTKNSVWKGFSSDAIYNGNTTVEIADMVDEIFEKYPLSDS